MVAEADVAALVATAAERFGGLHAAFNVAGASRPGLLVDLSEEDWDFTVDLCLKGVFFGVKHAGRQMIALRGGGAIVNIASLGNPRVPMFFGGAYSAAKAGVVSIGQTGALELAEHRIRVRTVSPGLTDTPLVAALTGIEEANAALSPAHPTRPGRASPDDIASAALYLASDDAGYISGVNLFVDGAWEQTGYPDLRPIFSQLMFVSRVTSTSSATIAADDRAPSSTTAAGSCHLDVDVLGQLGALHLAALAAPVGTCARWSEQAARPQPASPHDVDHRWPR